jgi:polysaccharide pyruvyl transferase WcaK-like protein
VGTWAARLAFYRSYRDAFSLDAMRQRGVDTARDDVYPDLVFGIPVPPYDPGDTQVVGVGVMDYHGTNDDRGRASELHASYVENMKLFVRWLVDTGRRVRLLVGDANGSDDRVVQEILADLRESRPDLDPSWVTAEPVVCYTDLVHAMAPVGIVVATRYHNVLCALRLCKPTISIGYSSKNEVLMAEMGLSGYCQFVNSLDVHRLIEQFIELESRSAQLLPTIAERNEANARFVDLQFAKLSAVLFPGSRDTTYRGRPEPARKASH